jgi:uncharacterized protein (TIGR03435 family)
LAGSQRARHGGGRTVQEPGDVAAIRRRVLDRTGLTGQFDYDLEWTPIAAPSGVPASAVPGASSDGPPNIFTALQEQLGLKLESTKEVIPVLVIDSVSQPSPD